MDTDITFYKQNVHYYRCCLIIALLNLIKCANFLSIPFSLSVSHSFSLTLSMYNWRAVYIFCFPFSSLKLKLAKCFEIYCHSVLSYYIYICDDE